MELTLWCSRRHSRITRRGMLRGGIGATGFVLAPLLEACRPRPTTTPLRAASSTPLPAGSQAGAATTKNIVWLVPEDPLIDKFARDAIVPGFAKQQPRIHVQVITPGSTAYGQKLLALVASGQVPEVFTDWGGASFYTLWNRKILADLSPYFAQAGVDPSYILAVYRDEYTVNGHLYAVPWNSNPVFIVYNKSLFDTYHVPLPPTDWNDKSWNLDRLLETARALTHNTGNAATATWGLIMGAGTCGSLSWLWNADPFNDKGGPEESPVYRGKPLSAVYPTRQGVVDAMTWLANLTLKEHVSPTPTDAQAMSAYGNPLFSGRVGMSEQAGGWLERQAAVVKPKFQWGIAPFPFGPGGRHTMQREDNAWYVGQKSTYPEAGFQLILYASRGEGADKLIEAAKDNPPIKGNYFHQWAAGILQIPGFAMTEETLKSVFEGGVQAGFGDPVNLIDNALEYSNAFNQLMAPVWLGKKTPEAGLRAVKDKWESIIKSSAG